MFHSKGLDSPVRSCRAKGQVFKDRVKLWTHHRTKQGLCARSDVTTGLWIIIGNQTTAEFGGWPIFVVTIIDGVAPEREVAKRACGPILSTPTTSSWRRRRWG